MLRYFLFAAAFLYPSQLGEASEVRTSLGDAPLSPLFVIPSHPVVCEGTFIMEYVGTEGIGWRLLHVPTASSLNPSSTLETPSALRQQSKHMSYGPTGELRTLQEFKTQCGEVKGELRIDAKAGTGDGQPSSFPLGAEVSLPFLPQLRSIQGSLSLTGAFHSMKGLEALEQVGGSVHIFDTNELVKMQSSLPKLSSVGGDVIVKRNWVLESLDGFNALRRVGGKLIVEENAALESINGFENLESAKALIVRDNFRLKKIEAFQRLKTIGERVVPGVDEFVKPGHVTCVIGQ